MPRRPRQHRRHRAVGDRREGASLPNSWPCCHNERETASMATVPGPALTGASRVLRLCWRGRFVACDVLEGHDSILSSAFHHESLPGCRAMWERVWPTEFFAHGNCGKTNRLLSGSFDFRQEKGESRAARIDRPYERNRDERAESCRIRMNLVRFETFREGALLIGQRRKRRIGPDRIIDLDVMSP